MFLSIIIPIYNDEKYISECLDSCLDQDISPNDYEIICVDDGSADQTRTILQIYAEKYPHINVILQCHQGGTVGRNTGFMSAKGEYVWFVDHDDFIESNILGLLREKAEATNSDRINFPCYIFHNQLTDEEKRMKKEGRLKPDFLTYRGTIWSSILKRSFLIENEIWPKSKKLVGKKCWGTDGFFIDEIRLAKPSISTIEDRPLYYYRINPNQETSNHSYKKNMARIEGTIDPVIVLKQMYENEKKTNGYVNETTADVLMSWMHLCMMYLAPMDHKSFADGLKRAKEAGIFPMKIVPEYSYSLSDCIKEHTKKGESRLLSIGYYYSSSRLGLMLYRACMWKVFVKRVLKKLRILN